MHRRDREFTKSKKKVYFYKKGVDKGHLHVYT